MKRVLFLMMMLFAGSVLGQGNPVQWQIMVKKVKDDVYAWTAKATIGRPWHLYSQATPEGGPVPSTIAFNKNPMIEILGETKEMGKMITKKEEVFGIDVKYYEGSVEFVQEFRLKRKIKTNLSGSIEFMVCNDNECLPPKKQSFSLAVE